MPALRTQLRLRRSRKASLPFLSGRAGRLFSLPRRCRKTESDAPLRRALRERGAARTSDMPGRTRRYFAAMRESDRRRRADPRYSCIPWPGRSGKRRRLAFWLRTLQASACGFSFVRSCCVSYYTVALGTSKWAKQDGYESQEIAEEF